MGYIISTPGQRVCKHMVIGSSLDTTIVVWKLIPFPANISIFAHPIMLGLNREGFCSQLFCLQPYNSGSRKVLCQYKPWRLTIAVRSFPKWMVKIFALFMWAIFPPLKPTSQDTFGGTFPAPGTVGKLCWWRKIIQKQQEKPFEFIWCTILCYAPAKNRRFMNWSAL